MEADARLEAAVGSVAEEATRLLEALGRSAAGTGGAAPDGSAPAGPRASFDADGSDEPESNVPGRDEPDGTREHVHVAMGDAETCAWCPVCRSVTLLRGMSPETLARLADLAGAAATVLADLATRHTETAGTSTAQRSAAADRTPRSEPIAVVDEEDTP